MADLENLLLQAAGRTGASGGRKNNSRPHRWRREGSYSDGSDSKDDDSDDSGRVNKRKPSGSQFPVKKRFEPQEKGKMSGWGGDDDDDEKLSGDDSDSAPSVGSDLYKGESDKEELEKMPELQREMILAERSTKIDDYKLRQKARLSSSKAEKTRKESPPPLSFRSRSTTRSDKTKSDALNELRAKRLKQQDPEGYRKLRDTGGLSGIRDSSPAKHRPAPMDESSSDSGESGNRSDIGDDELPEDNAKGDNVNDEGLKFEDIKDITIRRSKLGKWFMEPFFEDLIVGCFVRVGIGKSKSGNPIYRLCMVKNVDATDPDRTYKLEGRTTHKYLNCIWGGEASAARWQMAMVSQSLPLEEEFKEWLREVERTGGRMPSQQDVVGKKEEIKKINHYVYSAETVKQMLQEKKTASSRPLNVAAEKDRLRKEMEVAEIRGDEFEIERIRAKTKELEDMSRLAKQKDLKAVRLAEMNKKNRAENFKNASEVRPANTSLKAGEAGYDPFSRTRSTNYYVPKPGADGKETTADGHNEVAVVGSDAKSAMEDDANKRDPAWKYAHLKDPNNRNTFVCNFCDKTISGGTHRVKQHLAGGFRNAKMCASCPPHVRQEIIDYMTAKSDAKKQNELLPAMGYVDVYGEDENELDDVEVTQRGKRVSSNSQSVESVRKKPKQKGPMDMFYTPDPSKVVQNRKEGKLMQTAINEACKRELREKACRDFARWMYDAGIPFNALRMDSFAVAIESIGQFGPGMKPPSYHEVRVPFLKKEVDQTTNLIKRHKEEWTRFGCSIMLDGWKDSVANRDVINFLVNSPRGSVFLKSVDASNIVKSGERLFKLLDDMVEEIGEANVIQVVTDNASNYVVAGRLLEAKREYLYWTPCAAHCIDLMLEDIGKIPQIKATLKRVIFLSGYIYNRVGLVNMMRSFTGHKELLRSAITRFATAFITLRSMHMQKNNLRKMFTSNDWNQSKWVKEAAGKRAASIVMMPTFWSTLIYILKLTGPLVRVLRLVDGEKKPAMGYIYEAMDRAKEAIAKTFGEREEKYTSVFEMIDRRWECQLHRPLHAAGHFLNPKFYYANVNIVENEEIMTGLYKCIARLVPDVRLQDKITDQLAMYRSAQGLFGMPMVVRQRKTKPPAEWWTSYGSSTPDLQRFAVRVLSLTCSASGCERNWSIFQHLHSKRRNKLAQKRLNDLVFIKYNRQLCRRFNKRDTIDPILLNGIDDSNEWLTRRMEAASDEEEENDAFMFEDDSLTWGDVARATGINEPLHGTRRSRSTISTTRNRVSSSTGASTSRPSHSLELIDEANIDDSEEEEVEGACYKSSEEDVPSNFSDDGDDDTSSF